MDGEWNVNGFKLFTPCLGTITEIAKRKDQLLKWLNVTVKSQRKDNMCRENKSKIITISLLIFLANCNVCYFIQRLLLFLLTVPRLHLLVFLPVCLSLHYSWPVLLPRLMIAHGQVFHSHGPVNISSQCINKQYFHDIGILSCFLHLSQCFSMSF